MNTLFIIALFSLHSFFYSSQCFAKQEEFRQEKYENGSVKTKWSEKKNEAGEWIKSGKEEEFYENGKIKYRNYYENNKLNGLSQGWFDNGKLEFSETFNDDKKNGEMISYFPNGQMKTKSFLVNGEYKPESEMLEFFPNGKPMSIWIVNGEIKGYFSNGKLSYKGKQLKGYIPEGEFSFFYSSGDLKYRGTCHQGDEVGNWEVFTKLGKRYVIKSADHFDHMVKFPPEEKLKDHTDYLFLRKKTIQYLEKMSPSDFVSKVELNAVEYCETKKEMMPCFTSIGDCSTATSK